MHFKLLPQGGKRLLLVINPQWQTQGQVVSDFGCDPAFAQPLK